MAEFIRRIWHQIFSRSLGTNSLETGIFLVLPVLFVAWLVLANRRRIKREQESIKTAWEQKWQSFLQKYEISKDEARLLEKMAAYLEHPEQKYILLVNNHLFDSCLRHYLKNGGTGEELARTILLKAGLAPVSEELKGITFMRRSTPRKRVDLSAAVSGTGAGREGKQARIFDLSSTGASLDNPDKMFSEGNDLKLEFAYGEHTYSITAEVIRLTDNGTKLHVHFHRMGSAENGSA